VFRCLSDAQSTVDQSEFSSHQFCEVDDVQRLIHHQPVTPWLRDGYTLLARHR
jgi:isopentenyldiphosphate isomerase